MTRILCLWLANWPIQRIARSRPELKGQPIALAGSRVYGKAAPGSAGGFGHVSINPQFETPGKAWGYRHLANGGAQTVAVCSTVAVAQGVRVGMPVAEAQALAPQLEVLPHEPLRDRQALAKLAEACERFTPCVGLEEVVEPESLLLDISNLDHLWGNEASLVEQVEKFFKRRGYRVQLAVGDTIGLAWALAHFGDGVAFSCGAQRSMSMAAPDMLMPSTMLTHGARESMPPNEGPPAEPGAAGNFQFAAPSSQSPAPHLPVEALRISADTVALLRELGVETIDQLILLPREELTSRFGDELLRRLDQFTGAASEMVVPHRGLPGLEVSRSLEEPTADRPVLAHVLKELVEQLSRQLAARDQGAVLLVCLLRCTGGNLVPLQIGLLQPSASALQLMELIDLHLERLRLVGEVDRVEIRVVVAGRLGERQGELFADRWSSDPHQLALLVNRLSSRLGQEQVLRAELSKSPVPERAVRFVSLTKGWLARSRPGSRQNPAPWARDGVARSRRSRSGLAKSRRSRSAQANLPLSPSPPLPLVLHPVPHMLEVVCVAPDGPPQFVWLAGQRQRIVHHAGPERIETLWWRGPSVRRDYYRVALESGSHLWIFRRLTDRRWFLHGAFA